jgi:hypothetical protein
MKTQSCFWLMRIRVDVIETIRIKGRGPANDPVNLVALGEQKLGKVRAVLASDA